MWQLEANVDGDWKSVRSFDDRGTAEDAMINVVKRRPGIQLRIVETAKGQQKTYTTAASSPKRIEVASPEQRRGRDAVPSFPTAARKVEIFKSTPNSRFPPPPPYEIIEEVSAEDGSCIQVLSIPRLTGASQIDAMENLFYMSQTGMTFKMIRIIINRSKTRIEPGSLHFMKGNLSLRSSTGGLVTGLKRKFLSKETFLINEIHGSGELWLEPSFGNYILYDISSHDKIIVDKGAFFAGTSNISISAEIQKTMSSMLFGHLGLFQTTISGNGIAVILSPVPSEELLMIDLNNETLSVDGNFVLMRTASLSYTIGKSGKGWISTALSGEGFFHTFKGTGKVWLAPTQSVYKTLSEKASISGLMQNKKLRETRVNNKIDANQNVDQ